ncbi:helix-turn-helix domain-containing protein [Salmonella enterica subsp. enterica serovar Infantis]|nr:helix-turn-helix domain-containing protein [Salmonella enterica subsp. enterica serovar Infantis]
MSPSSLRCKFRHAYGCTVFDYLRDCRPARARRYLMEGYSVQQAARCQAINMPQTLRRHFVGVMVARPASCVTRL